jgi:hypothetical protein
MAAYVVHLAALTTSRIVDRHTVVVDHRVGAG